METAIGLFIILVIIMVIVVSLNVVTRGPVIKGLHGWEVRLQCPCGWHTLAPSGDSSHVTVGCCPKCGLRKPATAGKPGDWKLRVMKWTDGAWEAQK